MAFLNDKLIKRYQSDLKKCNSK